MEYVIYSTKYKAFMSARNEVNDYGNIFTTRIQEAKEFQSRGEANVWVANINKFAIKAKKKKPTLLVREKNTFQNK